MAVHRPGPRGLVRRTTAPSCPKSTTKRRSPKTTKAKSTSGGRAGASAPSAVPGTLCQRDNRWWWEVMLPGEDEPKVRPLRPQGDEEATDDLGIAQRLAVEMWERPSPKGRKMCQGRSEPDGSETQGTVSGESARFLPSRRDDESLGSRPRSGQSRGGSQASNPCLARRGDYRV